MPKRARPSAKAPRKPKPKPKAAKRAAKPPAPPPTPSAGVDAADGLRLLPNHLRPVLRTQGRARTRTAFLRAFRACGSVRTAAKVAGMSFWSHYQWLRKDEKYRKAFERAQEDVRQMLVDEAVRRGVHGVIAPVYQGGKLVGYKREYSDALLVRLLIARGGPDFKDKMEIDSGPVKLTVNHVRKPIPAFGSGGDDDND